MDQVRTIVLAVWQQRFWVLSVIVLIVAFVCWNNATTDLQNRFSDRKNSIDGKFQAVNSIISNQSDFHPNDDVNNGDEEQVKAQRAYVGKLWTELYEQQKNEVLFWPELGDGFAERMGKKNFGDEIDPDMRDKYRNYIKNQFEELKKIVKANDSTESGGRARSQFAISPDADPQNDNTVQNYLVDWKDQLNLGRRLEFTRMPSSIKIWVTQENIWVYKTLLNVIAKTNELHGATRPNNTAIRTIIELQIGKEAAAGNLQPEFIYIPTAPGEGSRMARSESLAGPMDAGLEGQFNTDPDGMILEGRYLDANGEPYPGDSDDFGTEFRKLPIRMVVEMDQRLLPIVLVECANATLPIEVTGLTVNREKSNTSGFSDRSGSRFQGAMGSRRQTDDLRSLSQIVIQGVVLIYEPPDESVLPAAEDETTT